MNSKYNMIKNSLLRNTSLAHVILESFINFWLIPLHKINNRVYVAVNHKLSIYYSNINYVGT